MTPKDKKGKFLETTVFWKARSYFDIFLFFSKRWFLGLGEGNQSTIRAGMSRPPHAALMHLRGKKVTWTPPNGESRKQNPFAASKKISKGALCRNFFSFLFSWETIGFFYQPLQSFPLLTFWSKGDSPTFCDFGLFNWRDPVPVQINLVVFLHCALVTVWHKNKASLKKKQFSWWFGHPITDLSDNWQISVGNEWRRQQRRMLTE